MDDLFKDLLKLSATLLLLEGIVVGVQDHFVLKEKVFQLEKQVTTLESEYKPAKTLHSDSLRANYKIDFSKANPFKLVPYNERK